MSTLQIISSPPESRRVSFLGLPSLWLGLLPTQEMARSTDSGFEAAYRTLHRTGEWHQRAEALPAIMEHCELCPRKCGVNRLEGPGDSVGLPVPL